MVRNYPFSETTLVDQVVERLQERLPASWRVQLRREPRGKTRPDALLNILSPTGTESIIAVEVIGPGTARYLRYVMETMRRVASEVPGIQAMAVARYFGARAREQLRQSGFGYADVTGNFYLALNEPPLFIETSGADRDPWPEDMPLQTLRGAAASRALRAFTDFTPPYGIRELAQRAEVPAPTLSRVAELLEREGIVVRDRIRGPILSVDWEAAIRRWVQDYSFVQSNRISSWLEPRGLESLEMKLRESNLRYALTGSLAASTVAPITAPRLGALYAERTEEAAKGLGLRRADGGGNVLLAEPFDPIVFVRGFEQEQLRFASYSQVTADLLTGPGRWPAEGEELIQWMKMNESAWRA